MKNSKKYIYALQLPHPSYHSSNIPLSLGYLAAYLRSSDLAADVEMQIAPAIINDHMGDSQLIKHLGDLKPDLLAFSVYPWNIERTISISKKLKEISNGAISTVFGGPEIYPENLILQRNAGADYLITGEGERSFTELARLALLENHDLSLLRSGAYLQGDRYLWNLESLPPVDLNYLPSPYLQNIIPLEGRTALNIFTYRGCMFKCKYCGWKSRQKNIRAFPLEQVLAELDFAFKHRHPTIYISDSALNLSPHFESICHFLEKQRPLKKAIRCFIHLISLTEEQASYLGRSGIKGVESGLQSISPEINKVINRRFNKDKFERGYGLLKKHGIDCLTDIIIGLPLADKQSIQDTINYVNHLQMDFSLFQLSVARSSELHSDKYRYRLKIQPSPPYYVLSTNKLTEKEINRIYRRYYLNSADLDICKDIEYPESALQLCDDPSDLASLSEPVSFPGVNITDWIIWTQNQGKFEIDYQYWIERSASKVSIWFVGDRFDDHWSLFFDNFIDYFEKHEPHTKLYIHFKIKHIDQGLIDTLLKIDAKIYRRENFLFQRDHFIGSAPKTLRNDCGHACLIADQRSLESIARPQQIKLISFISLHHIEDANKINFNDENVQGFCVSMPPGVGIDHILEQLHIIRGRAANPQRIYFCSPVMQRLWLQNVLGLTANPMDRNMLIFTPDQLRILHYTDHDIAWDAIMNYHLLKQHNVTDPLNYLKDLVHNRIVTIAKEGVQ